MKVLQIAPTDDSPEVIFDSHEMVMRISGRSFMEDTESFYRPIIDWLVDYCSLPGAHLELNLIYIYFSTSTLKTLVKLFDRLEKFAQMGVPIFIKWYSDEDDDDILNSGMEISELFKLNFSFERYNSENFGF